MLKLHSFRSVLRHFFESLPFIIFRKKMYPASSEEGDWPGGGEEARMLNKLRVLFVSLRPSQAFFFFFFFSNRIGT